MKISLNLFALYEKKNLANPKLIFSSIDEIHQYMNIHADCVGILSCFSLQSSEADIDIMMIIIPTGIAATALKACGHSHFSPTQ